MKRGRGQVWDVGTVAIPKLHSSSIRVSDLPEISKTRLLAALKKPPQGTFVFSESKFTWALIGLVVSLLGLWGVVAGG